MFLEIIQNCRNVNKKVRLDNSKEYVKILKISWELEHLNWDDKDVKSPERPKFVFTVVIARLIVKHFLTYCLFLIDF